MVRVAISYRVLQAWRVPVFERLSKIQDIELCVFYSDDFEGTKVKSFSGDVSFNAVKLPSRQFVVRTKNGKAYIPFNPTLFSELKRFQPDVIIVEGASNLLNNIASFTYAKRYNRKIIQWGLGEIEGRKPSIQRKIIDILFKKIEKRSDAAIAYSSFGANYYHKIGQPKKSIYVAVNVVDTEMRLLEMKQYCMENNLTYPSPTPQKKNILFIGSLSENKNIELLISSFKRVHDCYNDAMLTIVGDGNLRPKLEAMVKEYNLDDHIRFVGHQDKVCSYFYKASVMVLPGLGGLAISDSLIHGVPVICTTGDGCEKDLINDGNGIVIKKMNEETLTSCMLDVFSSNEKLTNMRISAQKFEFSNLNINNYTQKIYEAINYVAS